jgi:CemA family
MSRTGSPPGQLDYWLMNRQLKLLAKAYEAAKEIQALEEKYFNGGKITYRPEVSKTVFDYVKSLRDRQLLQVRTNLAQFRAVCFLLGQKSLVQGKDPIASERSHREQEIFDQLEFIDRVVHKYREPEDWEWMAAQAATTHGIQAEAESATDKAADKTDKQAKRSRSLGEVLDPAGLVVPQSRLGWVGFRDRINQIGREIYADEQQVLQDLRLRRLESRQAIRWAIILVLIPLTIHLFTKFAILNPVLGSYSNQHPTQIELSEEIRRHFLDEMTAAKGELEIRQLLGDVITEEEKQKVLHEKAVELWRESRDEAVNGLKNVIADGTALLGFIAIVFLNRSKLTTIRSATNRAFLNLRDPVKVFLFILVTDMFVGFHSAEGWEVILGGLATHLGLPESKTAIYGFIATVPVIMDSIVKFWIFSYLTRYSPSASAIYERMNT